MSTYNHILSVFQSIAQGHHQVAHFGADEMLELIHKEGNIYPLVWVDGDQASLDKKSISLGFNLIVCDRVDDAQTNLQEVMSDSLLIGLDIIAQLSSPVYREIFTVEATAQAEPFKERFADNVAGWLFRLTLKAPYLKDQCAIPSSYSPQLSSQCPPVQILSESGTLITTVASGSTYTVPALQTLTEKVAESTIAQIVSALNTTNTLIPVISASSKELIISGTSTHQDEAYLANYMAIKLRSIEI